MERRRSRRIKIQLKAERISGDRKHAIFIEDISEHGINIITTPENSHKGKGYASGSDVEIELDLASGETIKLPCKIRWSYCNVPPDGLTDSIGLEITDPPPKYTAFVKTLY